MLVSELSQHPSRVRLSLAGLPAVEEMLPCRFVSFDPLVWPFGALLAAARYFSRETSALAVPLSATNHKRELPRVPHTAAHDRSHARKCLRAGTRPSFVHSRGLDPSTNDRISPVAASSAFSSNQRAFRPHGHAGCAVTFTMFRAQFLATIASRGHHNNRFSCVAFLTAGALIGGKKSSGGCGDAAYLS